MLRTVIIGPDARQAQQLEKSLSALASELSVGRILNSYPDESELIRTLRTYAPEVIFLSFEKGEIAIKVVERVAAEVEGVQFVAYHQNVDATTLREIMRAGVREVVSERMVIVDHANWLNHGEITRDVPVRDVSANNDWSEVQVWYVPGHHWGGRTYNVQGFILNQIVQPGEASATQTADAR